MKKSFKKYLTKSKVNEEKFNIKAIIEEIFENIDKNEIKSYAKKGWMNVFKDVRNPKVIK